MTTARIEAIIKETAYPESNSVMQALLQVWNEVQQECNKRVKISRRDAHKRLKEVWSDDIYYDSIVEPDSPQKIIDDIYDQIEGKK